MAVVVVYLVTSFIASVALAFYCAVCAHVCWRQCRRAGFLGVFSATWANVRSRAAFCSGVHVHSEADLIAVEARKLFVHKRLQLIRGCLTNISYVMAVVMVYKLWEMLENSGDNPRHRVPMLGVLACILAFQTLISIFPRTLTPASADAFCVVITALHGVRLLDDDPHSFIALMPLTTLLHIIISVGISSLSCRVLVNVGLGAMTCVKCSIVYSRLFGEDSEVMNNTTILIAREVTLKLVTLLLCYALDANIWREARATVIAKLSRSSEFMANLLLTSLCDAVVHLNASFHICKPAPQLEALLMMRPQTADLVGKNFLDFIDATDRQQFAGRSGDTQGSAANHVNSLDAVDIHPARLMYLHLLDSSGTRVNVELLMATCLNFDDSVTHIVGIRELGCEEGPPSRVEPSRQSAAQQEPQSDTGSAVSTDSAESRPYDADADHYNSEITMMVDSAITGCLILDSTPISRGREVSSLVGTSLVDLIGDRQTRRLVGSIQHLENQVMNSCSEEADDSEPVLHEDFGQLPFWPRGRGVGRRCQASCTITVGVASGDSEGADVEHTLVEILTLKNLHRSGRPDPGCRDSQRRNSIEGPFCRRTFSTSPPFPTSTARPRRQS